MKNCSECRFAVFVDYGYSNWTVEGTEFICSMRMHPDGEFDRFYGEDKRLEYAEKCVAFTEGESVDIDVDREGLDKLTPEQRELWELVCEDER